MKECFSQTHSSARVPCQSETEARVCLHQPWGATEVSAPPCRWDNKKPSATSFSTGHWESWISVLTHAVVIATKLWDCLSTSKHKLNNFFFLQKSLSFQMPETLFPFDNGLHFKDSVEDWGFMELQWMALHACSIQPEAKRLKQGGRKSIKNSGSSFCVFSQMKQLLFWGDRPELLLLLLLSSYLGQIGGVWVPFLGLVASVQYRYWPDWRLTALQCFPVVHPLGPWGRTGSPTAHQGLATAKAGIYSCVLLVVTSMVVEDSDLFFTTTLTRRHLQFYFFF